MTDPETIKSWSDIPGFFMWVDRWAFTTLLRAQESLPPGHLVELGTYLGKSAVIIGNHVRAEERFVVVDVFGREDLFDSSASGTKNRDENRQQYRNLDRDRFERYYSALHPKLPDVHEGLSTDIVELVEPASVRFLHIDAGHMYDQVHQDVANAKALMQPGGIVAFDDFRTEWTPGVSAAVWEAVFFDGFIPFAVTPKKMFGVYDGTDPEPYRAALRAFVAKEPHKWFLQEQSVLGRPLLRIKHIDQQAGSAAKKPETKSSAGKAGPTKSAAKKSKPNFSVTKKQTTGRQSANESLMRRAADELAPPMLIRLIRKRRAAARNRGWPSPKAS